MSDQLEILRENLEQCDEIILDALLMRNRIVEDIMACKEAENIPILQPEQELKQEVWLEKKLEGRRHKKEVEDVFFRIRQNSKQIQARKLFNYNIVLIGFMGAGKSTISDYLRTAFAMAAAGYPGVFLAFDRKVMLGCRAVKVRASGFSAFESVNSRYAALVSNRGLVVDQDMIPKRTGEAELRTEVSRNVFLLKLTPGLNPAVFDMLAAMGYKGIVIEAFGLGGVTVLHKGLRGIHRCLEDGISVVVTTQCLYDSADLQVYQVGNKLLELGVIQGRDMTSEAAMTKLMWAIGQGMEPEQISALFAKNLAGEVTDQ